LSGGYQMLETINKCRECGIKHQGQYVGVAEVRRVCRRIWRLYVRWAGMANIYVGLERSS